MVPPSRAGEIDARKPSSWRDGRLPFRRCALTPRRAYLLAGLRFAAGVAVLGLVLSWVNRGALLEALASMSPLHYALAVLTALTSSIVVPAIVTTRTLRVAGVHMTLWEILRINLVIRFYVLLLPTAVTVGLRWLQYRGPTRGKGWQIAALIAFERVVQAVIVPGGSAVFLLVAGESVPTGVRFLLPLSAALAIAAACVLMLFLSQRVFALARPVLAVLERRLPGWAASRLDRLAGAVSDYHTLQHREVAWIVVWTVVGDLLAVVTAVVVSRGLGLDLGVADLGWMRATVFLLSLLPITVGGLGIKEAGYAGFLHLYGIEGPVALAYPLVLLSITLLIGLAGAGLEASRAIAAWRTEIGAPRT